MIKVLLLSALVGAALGKALPSYLPDPQLPETPKAYAFAYGVQDAYSGNDFGHQETHNGLQTKGQYRVALPDGRIQLVTYTADENGYVAEVTYEGEARFPPPPTPNEVKPSQFRALPALYAPPTGPQTTTTTTTTTTPAPPAADPAPASSGYLPLPLYQPPSASEQDPSRLRIESTPFKAHEGPFFSPARTLLLPAQ